MSHTIAVILSFILTLLPFVLVGWALYYMRVGFKLKQSRIGFLNGSKNDFQLAVTNYEKLYSIHTDTTAEAFREWKRKYGYLNEFIDFNYTKLGLDKDFTNTIRKYQKYMGQ